MTRTVTVLSMRAKRLNWYKPTDHPEDSEDALWMAHGIGGRYSITCEDDRFLLWRADDSFSFTGFLTLEEAQKAAEDDWQAAFARHCHHVELPVDHKENLKLLQVARELSARARDRLGRASRMQPDSTSAASLREKAWSDEDEAARLFNEVEAYLARGDA